MGIIAGFIRKRVELGRTISSLETSKRDKERAVKGLGGKGNETALSRAQNELAGIERDLNRKLRERADSEKGEAAALKARDALAKEQERDHNARSRMADDLKRACVQDDARGIRQIAGRITGLTSDMERRAGKLKQY